MTTTLLTTGHIVGLIFFAGFTAVCLVTAWSIRSKASNEPLTEIEFQEWFKDCRQQAYKDGYSSSAVEKLSVDAFRDYFHVGMTPSEAVNEYFSKD